jgi:hypothetical protein
MNVRPGFMRSCIKGHCFIIFRPPCYMSTYKIRKFSGFRSRIPKGSIFLGHDCVSGQSIPEVSMQRSGFIFKDVKVYMEFQRLVTLSLVTHPSACVRSSFWTLRPSKMRPVLFLEMGEPIYSLLRRRISQERHSQRLSL